MSGDSVIPGTPDTCVAAASARASIGGRALRSTEKNTDRLSETGHNDFLRCDGRERAG